MDDLRERVLRKKLLYDGDGTYEEKKIVLLIRDIAKLYLKDLAEDEFQKLYSVIVKNITVVLANADKSIRISERCDREVPDIKLAIQEYENKIESAKSELTKLHLELEYVDRLKAISVYPDCQTSEAQIREVLKKKEKLMTEVKKYRQHIKVIIESCRNLRPVIDDEPEIQPSAISMNPDKKSSTTTITIN